YSPGPGFAVAAPAENSASAAAGAYCDNDGACVDTAVGRLRWRRRRGHAEDSKWNAGGGVDPDRFGDPLPGEPTGAANAGGAVTTSDSLHFVFRREGSL